MDSLAFVEVPAVGYGIRYEFAIFDQDTIRDYCERMWNIKPRSR
jgi:glucan phosphorylase